MRATSIYAHAHLARKAPTKIILKPNIMANIKRFLTLILFSTLSALTMYSWGALSEAYSYTFEAKQFEDDTTAKTLGSVTWTPATSWSVGTGYWGYDATKGQQWGSGSHTLNTMTITSGTSFTNVKKITINASIASSGGCSLSVTVGGDAIGSAATLTTSADDYDFEDATGLSGVVAITLSNGSKKKAQYIKSITIYTEGGTPSTYTVTLDKNGTTSNITGCSGTYTLPTTGEHVADACTGWAWHCWANAQYTESTTAPSSTVITTMSSAGTAYAVYKHNDGAGSETFTPSASGGWTGTRGSQTGTVGNFTVATDDGMLSTEFRTYSGSTFTVSATTGNVTSITFTLSSGYSASNLTASTGTLTGNVWTGNENEVTFSASAQVRFDEIQVSSGTTTYTSTPPCGPSITISGQTWVTSTSGQTIKAILDVTGTSLTGGSTLSVTSSNARFSASLVSSTITSGAASTRLVVAYTPNVATDGTESTTLTVSADDDETTSQTFTLNGRHLPAQFVMVTKTNNDNKWWAVPGDMSSSNTYPGIEVTVDNASNPTTVTAGPANALYSLLAVASSRYNDYGTRVRLLGAASNGCLWSNEANKGTGIKNGVADGSGDQYEWTLTTTDGITYAINTNVAQKITEGRELRFYNSSTYGMYAAGSQSFRLLPVSCGTRATVSDVATTYNSATLTWTGDALSTYTLIVKQSGTTVETISSATSPTEVTGLDASTEYTYILTPGTESDNCALTGTFTTETAPITVTLSCDGKTYNLGEQTAPFTLPTGAPYTSSCAEAPFAGWSATSVADESASFTAVTQAATTGTYYAVYKHTSGSGGDFDGSAGGDFLIYASVSGTNYYATADLASGKLASTTEASNAATFTFTKISNGEFSIKIGSDYYYYSSSTNLATQNSSYSWFLSAGTHGTWRVTSGTPGRAWIFRAGSTNKFGGYSTGNVDGTEYFDIEISGGGTTTYSTASGCCNEVDVPEVTITPRSTSATISWVKQASATNGYKVVVALGTDTVHNSSYSATTASCIVEGLTENTTYTYTVTAKGATCNRATTEEFTTTEGDISVAEWDPNAVYLDLGDMVSASAIIENQNTQAQVKKKLAEDLFFAKYFEGEGSMKLISIYNGTGEEKDLSQYAMRQLKTGTSSTKTVWSLGTLGTIADGQEIILFSRPKASETAVAACANAFLDEKAEQNAITDNPRWILCDSTELPTVMFNGDDALEIVSVVGTDSTAIDRFGAITGPSGNNCRSESSWSGTIANMDYGKHASDFPDVPAGSYDDYGIDTTSATITARTARVILFRDSSVVSGSAAVTNNTTDFVTMGSEWNGRYICVSGTITGHGTCNSFADIGTFKYDEYYAKYDTIMSAYSLDDKRQDDGTYKIEIPQLDTMSCTNLRITVTNTETGKTVSDKWKVPIFVQNTGSTILTTNTVFTKEGDDCATCDVVVLKGAKLQVATNGKNTVRNIEIYPDAKLDVPSGQTFNINQLILRSKDDTVPRVDVQGTINQTDEQFGFEKRIKATRWYKIALPYRCKIADVTFRNGNKAHYGKDWVLRTYNGDRRANGTESGNWDNYTGEYMEPGVGYNLAIDGDILDPGNTYAELHFPMTPNDGFEEDESITVPVVAYGANNSRTKDGEPVTPNHLGWNMIGNPYMLDYTTGVVGSDPSPLTVGELKEVDEAWTLDKTGGLRYVVKLNDTSREYEQIAIGDGKKNIEPFLAYFVQIDGTSGNQELNVVFTANKQQGRSSIIRRSPAEYEEVDNHPVWCVINLTNVLDEQDETTFLISDDFTDDYDMMDDLVKMRGDKYTRYTKPVLASRNNAGEMAFNALPDQSAAAGIPLNYFAAADGDFTIALDGRFGIEELKDVQLYDSQEKKWIDLRMENNYPFYTTAGNNDSRFMLYVTVERKQPEVTTNIDNATSNLTLTTIDRTLIVSGLTSNSDIYVYDVSGKLLNTERHSSSVSGIFRTTVEDPGVYFVRVNSTDGQQTLRTIVY